MSLDMTTVKSITVPQGTVVQIKDSNNNVLWETPKKYRKLEYIQSGISTAKGQYCIQFNDLTGEYYSVTYQLTSTTWARETGQFYGGLVACSGNNGKGGYADNYSSKFTWSLGSSSAANCTSELWNQNKHTVRCNWNSNYSATLLTIDGSTKTNFSNNSNTGNISLFGQKYNNSEWSLAAKVYEFNIIDGQGAWATNHYCYPAQNRITGEVGMYCTYNNKFYTNIGTGTLIAGPTVTEEWM